MKLRGMKQVFHWIFLLVGVFSLILTGITVNTYLDYAREGYGLEMSFESANLNYGNWLVLRFYFVNPGKLDINLVGGNLSLSRTYNIPHGTLPNGLGQDDPISPLPAGENTTVVIWIPISDPDLGNIQMHHQADIDLNLEIYVPGRYARTHINFRAAVGVAL